MNSDDRIAAEMTQLVLAFKQIAGSLQRLAIVSEKAYDKVYPKREPRDATVTKVKNERDELIESLGGSGDESLEAWLGGVEEDSKEETLGPRERALVERKTK